MRTDLETIQCRMCFLLHVEKYLPTNIEDQPIRSSKLSGCASKALISSLVHREKCRIGLLEAYTRKNTIAIVYAHFIYIVPAAYDVARGV